MWFMVPGSQLALVWTSGSQASAPRCVINWEKWNTTASPLAPLACYIGKSSILSTLFWSSSQHLALITQFFYIPCDFWIWEKNLLGFATPSFLHTAPQHTEQSFPCSCPLLVSPYFLSWLRAVSFFRSCIYPLGMLTSFEQHFINSISNSVPWQICFYCTDKTLFYSSVVWFDLTISISKEKPSLEYC